MKEDFGEFITKFWVAVDEVLHCDGCGRKICGPEDAFVMKHEGSFTDATATVLCYQCFHDTEQLDVVQTIDLLTGVLGQPNPKVYKVVRRLGDGQLVSSYIDKTNIRYHELIYEYGKVTKHHPNTPNGIFCHRYITEARMFLDVWGGDGQPAEVREVYSIGKEIPFFKTSPKLVNYPAVLVGKKVVERYDE